jgi:hypothetical protein
VPRALALLISAALAVTGCGTTAAPSAPGVTPRPSAAPPAHGWSWERLALDEKVADDTSADILDLAATQHGFVAVGTDEADAGSEFQQITGFDATLASMVAKGDADALAAAVWISPDGRSWRRVEHDPATFGGPGRQIAWAAVPPVSSALSP